MRRSEDPLVTLREDLEACCGEHKHGDVCHWCIRRQMCIRYLKLLDAEGQRWVLGTPGPEPRGILASEQKP